MTTAVSGATPEQRVHHALASIIANIQVPEWVPHWIEAVAKYDPTKAAELRARLAELEQQSSANP